MAKFETHSAIVVRNIDDDAGTALRGAVFFDAPTLFEGEFPLPALPCFPFASAPNGAGFFWVPKVGDQIEVVILSDDGTFDTTDIEIPEPRYICMTYSDAADIAQEFKTNYPFRMGWKSNTGHILLFDDKTDAEKAFLKSGKGHELTFDDASGSEEVTLKHLIGTLLKLDNEGSWLETIIKDKAVEIAENLTVNIGGDRTVSITGNDEESVTGDKTISATGELTLTAEQKATLSGVLGTEIGDSASVTDVLGLLVNLAGGGLPVATLTSQCLGVGNLGMPVVSNVVTGSSKVTAAL